MKIIKDIVISTAEPPVNNVGWLKPLSNGTFMLYFFGNNGWTSSSNEVQTDKDIPTIYVDDLKYVNGGLIKVWEIKSPTQKAKMSEDPAEPDENEAKLLKFLEDDSCNKIAIHWKSGEAPLDMEIKSIFIKDNISRYANAKVFQSNSFGVSSWAFGHETSSVGVEHIFITLEATDDGQGTYNIAFCVVAME